MEKGPFSVEWLAQSSRSGGRGMPGESRPAPPQTPPSVPADTARDREAAERRSPGHDAGSVGTAPGRARTKFSAAQLQELERSFREQRYIRAGEKRRLAAVLNLSQSQIKTWFQNRRMKFKRQTQDAR
ncbi:VEX1 protein, partial [Pachycephala philippinensis]|nr:VEX1 protein [Pachycephala philippinensis]